MIMNDARNRMYGVVGNLHRSFLNLIITVTIPSCLSAILPWD